MWKVVAGKSDNFSAKFVESPGVQVVELGLDECKRMLRDFIENKSAIWSALIG